MKNIIIKIIEYEGDQIEIDLNSLVADGESTFNLDRPQFSICPKCSAQVIKLSEGCGACGWDESVSLSKTRRQPGEGSGAIFYRTVTKNGRDYQEAYYKWRENGRQRSKYIPNKLLNEVKQAESRKLPIKDILVLLAGKDKCSRKNSDTDECSRKNIPASKDRCSRKIIPASKDECSRKIIPAIKKRRGKGKGGGWIECKPIKLKGKEYKQYWYHYETWSSGDRMVQSSKYIPKKMEAKIIRMNNEKESVEKILKVLESKSKRRK